MPRVDVYCILVDVYCILVDVYCILVDVYCILTCVLYSSRCVMYSSRCVLYSSICVLCSRLYTIGRQLTCPVPEPEPPVWKIYDAVCKTDGKVQGQYAMERYKANEKVQG